MQGLRSPLTTNAIHSAREARDAARSLTFRLDDEKWRRERESGGEKDCRGWTVREMVLRC